MLVPPKILAKCFGIRPNGVVHIGAHKAEEELLYKDCGWQSLPTYWIEAQKNLAEELSKRLDPQDNKVYWATVWNTDGEVMNLNITSNSQSSSLLELGTHEITYPTITRETTNLVRTTRLDSLLREETEFDFINIDIQGTELQALDGMGQLLGKVKWIYAEVNKWDVYKNCTKVWDLDEFLGNWGFKRVHTRWIRNAGWGDALYGKQNEISLKLKFKSLSLSFRNILHDKSWE